MSTICYLRDEAITTPYQFSTGNNDAPLGTGPWGATTGWVNYWVTTTRGAGVQTTTKATVSGNTTGIEFPGAGDALPAAWISAPLDADVTISGTITFNLWMGEATTSVNMGAMCVVERIDSTGAIVSTIASSAKGVECPKTSSIAAQNWTVAATSTNMLKGDRLRIRVVEKNVGTMGTDAVGGTFTYSGTSAAATGDSYVQFTETFGFLTTDPNGTTLVSQTDITGSTATFGYTLGASEAGQSFQTTGDTVSQAALWLLKTGTPTDNVTVRIETDAAGLPSGSVVATSSTLVAGSTLTTSAVRTVFAFDNVAITPSTTYWVIASRSGANDASNVYAWDGSTTDVYASGAPATKSVATGLWSNPLGSRDLAFEVIGGTTTTVYPTNANSDIDPGGATVNTKEAWTARGSGWVEGSNASVAGWTAPIQLRTSGGSSNFVEWFTKPMTAVTLGGAALVHVRGSAASANNAIIRAEVATCATDGTSPVVWAATSYPTALSTSDAAYEFYLAGDDTALTDGQRLRLRFYFDDSSTTAMTTGINTFLNFSGTSAGATGDSYLIFGQTLTEYVAATTPVFLTMAPPRA